MKNFGVEYEEKLWTAVHSFSSYSTPKFFMENPLETQNFHSQNTNYRYKNYRFATEIYQWGDDTYAQATIPEALDTNFIFMIAAAIIKIKLVSRASGIVA